MDPKIKEMVINSIYQRFPFMNGVKPTVRKKERVRMGFLKQTVHVFTFKGEGKAPDGTKMQQRIVVTTTDNGRIIKTVTSR